jgi:arginine/lysine/ornithine decarboxylase
VRFLEGNILKTPVYDFVERYIRKNSVRAHMPGHKGKSFLGLEQRDITEIAGADVLCESTGILGESQKRAAELFGAGETIYSTEGSSLAIKGMLYGALMKWKTDTVPKMKQISSGNLPPLRPVILAARNVHRAMIDGCGFLDMDIEFIPGQEHLGICSAVVTPMQVEQALSRRMYPVAVYLTSPDYLGVECDIQEIARVCHRHHVLLLVDNAHGGYLAFLDENRHPMALGADMCCDSAHKTLPVLTGGAYLHLSQRISGGLTETVRRGMALFGSTSPSYLILQSLDLGNKYLAESFSGQLKKCVQQVAQLKESLRKAQIPVLDGEPLKITIHTAAVGYSGKEISREMRMFAGQCRGEKRQGIECEYADDDLVVLMMTPQNGDNDWEMLYQWLEVTTLRQRKNPLSSSLKYALPLPRQKMTIREAMLSPSEMIPVQQSVGRILAQETVSCPPAIPIAISGEEITGETLRLFLQYGIRSVSVVVTEKS